LGRSGEQRAYEQLSQAGFEPTLVLNKTDTADYSGYRHVYVPAKGIAPVRQAILELAAGDKFAMFDDDMTLNRVDVIDGKCVIGVPTPRRLASEINKIDKLLDKYAHGGVHTRHFVNYAKQPYELNKGYHRSVVFFNPALMPVVPRYVGYSAEDVRFMIGLLEQGLDYFIATSCCMIEKKSKVVPTHFTQEKKNVDMYALAAEYPKHARPQKTHMSMSYRGILKDAKKRLGIS
jgi:hypothetical protein